MTQHFAKPSGKQERPVLYTNARLFDPESGFDAKGMLLTSQGKIVDFGPALKMIPEDAEKVDCKGHLLCPGLLDIQVHFREPGQEHKETIETGSKSAAAGGVTRVVCMPNTQPRIDDVSVLEFVNERARETAYVHVHAYGAITKDLKGEQLTEMGLLKESGAVGFTDDGLPIMNALVMRRALTYARELDLVVAQHAEDLNLSGGGCINEGEISARLGLRGIPNASEAVIVARDIILQQLTGGHYHVLHISTAEAVELVRQAKKRGQRVTAEAAPHHFLMTDEAAADFRTFAKMNPPLRAEKDRLAILEGLRDGTIDAIATDHAPHDQESKRVPMSSAAFGIVGLETMLPLSLELVHKKIMTLREVIAAMTYKPADIIRTAAGRLKKGASADLTLIDLGMSWNIDTEDFCSKSLNAPFDGWKTKGRAIRTVVAGETVYRLEA